MHLTVPPGSCFDGLPPSLHRALQIELFERDFELATFPFLEVLLILKPRSAMRMRITFSPSSLLTSGIPRIAACLLLMPASLRRFHITYEVPSLHSWSSSTLCLLTFLHIFWNVASCLPHFGGCVSWPALLLSISSSFPP